MQASEMPDLAALGAVIRDERLRRGLSQEALADLSGLSRTHVGEVERGEVGVSFLTLQAVAKGLGMPLSDIVKEYEWRTTDGD